MALAGLRGGVKFLDNAMPEANLVAAFDGYAGYHACHGVQRSSHLAQSHEIPWPRDPTAGQGSLTAF